MQQQLILRMLLLTSAQLFDNIEHCCVQGPAPVWLPSEDEAAQTNVAQFMQAFQVCFPLDCLSVLNVCVMFRPGHTVPARILQVQCICIRRQ